MQRRLAAILAADVVGYSKLMGEDEDGTLAALRRLRRDVFAPLIAQHHGNLIKSMGDGWLLEFASARDAVACAVDVQENLKEPDRIKLRIGVHVGDVMFEEEDIYGDGVNIAARLQEIADPGAIAISDFTRRSIDKQHAALFRSIGLRELKNIAEPVSVYVLAPTEVSPDSLAQPLSALDKPSIAILPFDNMSGDVEQDYFADGITEDIITAISKYRWFHVTARNSSFSFKGKAVDIKQVGRELGVRYVLEGSVRKSGQRLRITAQLIEAETGNHIWAEKYDRLLEDIFDLQDEITSTIAGAVEPELAGSERQRALQKPTEALAAWDWYQRGIAKIWDTNLTSVLEGMDHLSAAIKIDPNFASAYGYRAFGAYCLVVLKHMNDAGDIVKKGFEDAEKAIQLDRQDSFAHLARGRLLMVMGQPEAAIKSMEAALSYTPNFAHGYYGLAAAQSSIGDLDTALQNIEMAIRLSPNDPLLWGMLMYKAGSLSYQKRYEDSLDCMEAAARQPNASHFAHAALAAAYLSRDREADAKRALQETLEHKPDFRVRDLDAVLRITSPRTVDHIRKQLLKLGLPQ